MVNVRNLTTLLAAALAVPFGAAAPVADPTVDAVLESIKDKYIVTFKTGLEKRDMDTHVAWVNGVQRRNLSGRNLTGVEQSFDVGDFHAYTGHFDDDTIEEIKADPAVKTVEPDAVATLAAFVTQNNAPWGLATISNRQRGQSTYRYDDSGGRDRWAYVIDSGIRASHQEFGGRVTKGYNVFSTPFEDSTGHGTAVAGIIGGRIYGVAKAINIVDVKVFQDRTTSVSAILQGLVWAQWDVVNRNRVGRAVINMSIGTDIPVTSLNDAVNAVYDQGTLVVTASGNGNVPGSQSSPGSAARALNVGAVDSNWNEAGFSNYGSTVKILAPGVGISTASYTSDTAIGAATGTSLAAPFVAGVAMYMSRLYNINDPATQEVYIRFGATIGIASRKSGSPDAILYNRNR